MRILHVSDTHLGIRQPVLGAPAGWSRADDHLDALKLAVERAGPVDLIVHTGDLFDRSRPPRRAIQAAAALLTGLAARCPVVVMRGNHDRRGLSTTVPLDVSGLHVVNQAERLVVAGLALAVVPFLSDARGWAFAAAQAVGPGADLLLCHQAVDGCQVPGFTFRAGRRRDTLGPQHLPAGIRHLLCGHIHPRQALRLGAAQVVMPGSTARSSFSERDQVKGAALWEIDRTVRWRWLDLPSRPMALVSGPDDLDQVQAGTLVRLDPHSAVASELRADCLTRGAYVVEHHPVGPGRGRARSRERRQLGLF